MKNLLILVMVLVLVSCNSSDNGQNDIEAIKAAIEAETQSFIKGDKPTWDASWVQANHSYWSYSDSTGSSYIEGWDNISKNFEELFKDHKANRNIDVVTDNYDIIVEREWQEFRVYGDGAYVRYTQKVKDKEIDRPETSQIRVLEKNDGKWQIAYVGIIEKYQ